MPQAETKTRAVEDADGRFEISSPHIQYLIDAVGRFTDEARLQVEDGLLKLCEVDAAHVAVMEAGAPLVSHEGEDGELFLPVDIVKKALAPVPLGEVDPITFAWKDNRMTLGLPGGHEFSYDLLDTSGMTNPKVPDLDLPVELDVKSRLIWDAVRRVHNMPTDHAEFLFEDTFTISSGNENAAAHHRSVIDVEEYVRTGDRARSLYSMAFLRPFTCADAFQGNVRMELGNDFPIKLHMTPGDAKVLFMLAPRVEGT